MNPVLSAFLDRLWTADDSGYHASCGQDSIYEAEPAFNRDPTHPLHVYIYQHKNTIYYIVYTPTVHCGSC